MRNSLYLALLLFLAGCVTTVATPYTHFPEKLDDPEMIITARAEHGFYTDKIFITVNNEDFLAGEIKTWKLEEKLVGTYQTKEIKAYCYAVNDHINTLTRHYCNIYIEGKRVTRLSF